MSLDPNQPVQPTEPRTSNPDALEPELAPRIIDEQTTYVDGELHSTRTERPQVVVHSAEDMAWLRWRGARRAVYFSIHVIAIFILIRFFLMMFGANPDNAFAAFIYGLTWFFIAPFVTLFGPGAEPTYGVPVFNASALVAIAMYYLFAWIGLQTARILMRRRALNQVERQPVPPVRR